MMMENPDIKKAYTPIIINTPKKPKKKCRKVYFMCFPQDMDKIKPNIDKKSVKDPRKARIVQNKVSQIETKYSKPTTKSDEIRLGIDVPLTQFIDSFKDHTPLSFDIIQRGPIPAINIANPQL